MPILHLLHSVLQPDWNDQHLTSLGKTSMKEREGQVTRTLRITVLTQQLLRLGRRNGDAT
jgi:hypothetical protein